VVGTFRSRGCPMLPAGLPPSGRPEL
jgi:hypothetical protein